MASPSTVELNASQAATLLQRTLQEAGQALRTRDTDSSFDGYVGALGLALQLGPAPTETAVLAIRTAADQLAKDGDSKSLCTLGPALVSLVDQIRASGALPETPTMDSWATVATEIGTLIGQVGLALAIPPERRSKMMANIHARALLLDDVTGGRFTLGDWLSSFPVT